MTALAIAQAPLDFGRFAFLTERRKRIRDMIAERYAEQDKGSA